MSGPDFRSLPTPPMRSSSDVATSMAGKFALCAHSVPSRLRMSLCTNHSLLIVYLPTSGGHYCKLIITSSSKLWGVEW